MPFLHQSIRTGGLRLRPKSLLLLGSRSRSSSEIVSLTAGAAAATSRIQQEQHQQPELSSSSAAMGRQQRTASTCVVQLLLLLGLASLLLQHGAAWRPAPSPARAHRASRCFAHHGKGTTGSDGGGGSSSSSSSSSSQRRDSCSGGSLSRQGFAVRSLSLAALLLGLPLPLVGSRPRPAQARTEPLGVINEILADCARTDNCVSSQDDRPPVFAEPWAYESSADKAMARLKGYVGDMPGAEIITSDDRYLRVEFRTGEDIDDAEWFFVDPDSDAIIEFRAARRGDRSDGGANARRLEKIRIALGFEKVPVLRNRRRALFIMESPLDAFGPSYGVDAPPPQELGDVYKDNDPFSPTWEGPNPYPRPAPRPK